MDDLRAPVIEPQRRVVVEEPLRQVLSVVIPAFNERNTIASVLLRVVDALPAVQKEIIIVDDGSSDGTREWLALNISNDALYHGLAIDENGDLILSKAGGGVTRFSFRVVFHERNKGKGGALQTGLRMATGDVVVIQDADLEYDPEDWVAMYNLIAERRVADVVYGTRFSAKPHRALYYHHLIANKFISIVFNIMYNQALSDIEVCYKMISREVLQTLALTCNDFGIEIELSAQIARKRTWRIYEMGITYYGRTYLEGKKINWKDGVKALWYLVKFRIV